ncbi:MAG: hypothetical protein KDD60_03630 [Bdellovibrionales bacterium]|nr:hypothetical protein [Bdellovibrionales bacterium]
MNRFLYILFLLFWSANIASVKAQEEECSGDNPDACTVQLTLYCERDGAVPLSFGITDDLDMGFTVQFPENPPASKMTLFAVDGEVESGKVSETKLTSMKCKGSECLGTLTYERFQELEGKFNFDQSFINFVIRKGGKFGKDLCIGKFTNNPDLITQNNSGKRVLCAIQPAEGNDSLSGIGYFEPGGYGTDGDAFFHLEVSGLDVGTNYSGCSVVGENRYKKVLQFSSSLKSDASDTVIYGELSSVEQAEFNRHAADYSYDLYREVFGSEDAVQTLLTPSLSLINKGVSSDRASSSVASSNAATSKERRKQRRKRKEQGKRARSAVLFAADASLTIQAKKKVTSTLAWLNFDPLGGQLIISTSCKSDANDKAVATLVCGEEVEDENRSCQDLTTSESGVTGTICRETWQGVGRISILTRGLSEGTYHVCLNGAVIEPVLQSSTASRANSVTSGQLKLTDSATLASGDSTFSVIESSVATVTAITISESTNCSEAVGSVSF